MGNVTAWDREQRERLGPEPATLRERLEHTLAAFADQGDGEFAVTATHGLYGPGVRTGLTWGDLREIVARFEGGGA